MVQLKKVFGFGWPYLRRYLTRFAAGVLLAIFFGVTNAGFLWAINTVLSRMSPPTQARQTVGSPSTAQAPSWKNRLEQASQGWVDGWLPRAGQPLDWERVVGGLLLFPLLAIIRGFSGYLSSYSLAWVSERLVNDLRVDVLQKLSTLSLDFFDRARMGDLITRVNGDTASLQRCLSLGLSDLIKEPVTIVSIVLGLCLIDWKLTVMAVFFLPLLAVPIIYFGRRVRRAAKAGLNTSIDQSSLLVEMLSGIRMVKAFGLEDHQVERFRNLSHELVHHGMKGIRAKEIINPIIETVSTAGFGILLVYIVYRQIRVEAMITLLAGMAFIYTPIKKLANINVLLEQTRVGIDRLMHILAEQPTIRSPKQPVPLSDFSTALEFKDVSFSYGHQTVLKDVCFTLRRGTRVGIAGESGSGKSTLVNLLFRFYDPTAGVITIDGHPLTEVALSDLRGLMALVSQEIVIFDLTVAANIACGRRGATREEIEEAARAAQAHEFIERLPHGYDTRVGERGVTLSGGQRQRLAIARAFVRNAPILVLDEATASLDSQSEAEVQAAIERLEENRTVLCVAHRLSTLAKMDKIVVLSQGRILEEGTFWELIRAGGMFAAMARRQGIVAAPVT